MWCYMCTCACITVGLACVCMHVLVITYCSDDNDDEGMDKQMGEVNKDEADNKKEEELDRNMWAPEDEDEEDKEVRLNLNTTDCILYLTPCR